MPRPSPYRSLTIAAVTAGFDGAICRQIDPDLWFPDGIKATRVRREAEENAIALCRLCPHQNECLEVALTDPTLMGVWGGTTTRQRKRLLAVS